jgi:hypothetical protein
MEAINTSGTSEKFFGVKSPCGLVGRGQRFGETPCHRYENVNSTTLHDVNIQEDGHLHARRRKNLKFHTPHASSNIRATARAI